MMTDCFDYFSIGRSGKWSTAYDYWRPRSEHLSIRRFWSKVGTKVRKWIQLQKLIGV